MGTLQVNKLCITKSMRYYDKQGFAIPKKGDRAHVQLTLHHDKGHGSWGSYDVPYWVVTLIRNFGKKVSFHGSPEK